jgi:precorrin-2 dehydrogenase/sirohydrochlorin ferrochelatase
MLNVAGRRAVVVGGGKVALRKAQDLIRAGAQVRVVSPRFVAQLRRDRRLVRVAEPYSSGHLAGASIVIAATDDEAVNARVAADAAEAGALVNVVDRPSLCDFIVPATVKRGRLTIAISTGGAAPSLARRLRERLQEEFGPSYATYVNVMDEVRREIQARGLSEKVRRRIFERLSEDDIVQAAKLGAKGLRKKMVAEIEKIVSGK